ncbi:transketolase [Candidatus Kinetoplastibacterium desouzaii TCC079E]|uniref:Transketolase n=1 Tax=Candidatus Kinetoplastidibacterium desouzai TCC079E TaxID=1208919 RepID=M1LR96_9PROT|nr:transketolase [Candidatus Kinetoplastibacterium desouzaii]AGF46681.1 transketolase [Candidatus Kinetoplastibacterium desouzaii TCC079E]
MGNITTSKFVLSDAIRILAMDAVQQANSGHPGAPMGMAEMAQALWKNNLKHNPNDPNWIDRDRFVLSNGHGSMLVYALLHLTGYDVSIDDLRNFRQLHSKTPGHPEVGITPGIETTTGPLGQGLANAVGMALAESLLAEEFNKPDFNIIDHHTYAIVGDGCLMEGISHEVCSLAGTLKLSKLIVLYDDNGISIDGDVKNWFNDNTAERFRGYGWNVIEGVNGHDVSAVDSAIKLARCQSQKPTIIICKTVIGKGSPNMAGTHKVHGSPLGSDEIIASREFLNWNYEPFVIPEFIYNEWSARENGQEVQNIWQSKFDAYLNKYPSAASELKRRMQGNLPDGFENFAKDLIQKTIKNSETIATRKASQNTITEIAKYLPEFLGGSADLTGSNFTDWKGVVPVRAGVNKAINFGRHINYGVREFGMAAIMNGIALHGGYLPFGGTFLTFSDYSRNAIRMSALMKQKVVHVFTHDSIGLGEDGPTHQSIEHAASLRLIPNLSVWRPCDTVETTVAWLYAIQRPASVGMKVQDGGPSALLLSRQNLPFVERDSRTVDSIYKGGYVLKDSSSFSAIIIATGSEVAIALDAQQILLEQGIRVRVVSMPSVDVFDKQDLNWKESVLPRKIPKIAIEAGVTTCWYKYVGLDGLVLGIDRYGESAPAGKLFKFFGLTVENVISAVKKVLL